MGQFSNGTEGASFVELYCSRCVNWRLDESDPSRGEGCPVWDAHLLAGSQYPEHATTDYKRGEAQATAMLLSLLIAPNPTNRCLMFLERPGAVDPRQGTLP